MQHRTGLPLHWQFIYENEPYQRPTMEETIFRYGIVVRPPGEAYNYANLDYGVIEYLIERMSGLSYEDFMRREVFVPLGLPHTAVGPTPDLRDVTAALYDRGKRLPFMDFDQRGALRDHDQRSQQEQCESHECQRRHIRPDRGARFGHPDEDRA